MDNKRFYKSSVFWAHNITQIGVILMAFSAFIPANISAILMAVVAGVYIFARGIGKSGAQYNSSSKPFWHTSEFYVTVLGAIMAIVAGLDGIINPEMAASIMTALTAAYQVARRMSKIGDPNSDIIDKIDDKTFTKDDLKSIINEAIKESKKEE